MRPVQGRRGNASHSRRGRLRRHGRRHPLRHLPYADLLFSDPNNKGRVGETAAITSVR